VRWKINRGKKNNSPPQRQQPTESAISTSERLANLTKGKSNARIERREVFDALEIARVKSRDCSEAERLEPVAIMDSVKARALSIGSSKSGSFFATDWNQHGLRQIAELRRSARKTCPGRWERFAREKAGEFIPKHDKKSENRGHGEGQNPKGDRLGDAEDFKQKRFHIGSLVNVYLLGMD
jgi:hypothetical protein